MSKIEKTMSISCVVIFIGLCLTLTVLGIFFLSWFINWPHVSDYCLDSEIYISKDEDFKLNGFLGNGRFNDPYRLENISLQIDGLCIKNTAAHFVIRNCSFSGGYYSFNLEYIKAGTATIENNTFTSSINIEHSPKTTFVNNILRPRKNITHYYYDTIGIDLVDSDYSIFKGNSFSNFEIGLNVYYSNYLLIEDNDFKYNGWWIWNIFGQQSYLINNHFFNNSICISLSACINIHIINNYIVNSYSPISLEVSYFCLIIDCVIENNIEGISLYHSNNNHIKNNLLQFNLNYGFQLLSSTNNSIYSNNLIDNPLNGTNYGLSQAYDDQSAVNQTLRNYWFDSLVNEGNFWSDLVWYEGVIYEIDSGNNIDPYPLEHPVDIWRSASCSFPLQHVITELDF